MVCVVQFDLFVTFVSMAWKLRMIIEYIFTHIVCIMSSIIEMQ